MISKTNCQITKLLVCQEGIGHLQLQHSLKKSRIKFNPKMPLCETFFGYMTCSIIPFEVSFGTLPITSLRAHSFKPKVQIPKRLYAIS